MPAFMLPRDIGLFLRSARTDARLAVLSKQLEVGAALEAVYAADADPWASASPLYRYQRRKYEVIASMLPQRQYRRALDLGCGVGLLSRHLADVADEVLGVDISPSAIAIAEAGNADRLNLTFEAHDVLNLPGSFNGIFELVVVADVLYYLSPFDDTILEALAARLADLLTPDGVLLLANHYVLMFDPDSRRSRRIDNVFRASTALKARASYRRPFYLVSLFDRAGA